MGLLKAEYIVEINAPIERCYEIIADLENTPDWQETMLSMEILETDSEGRATLVETVADAKIKHITTKLAFSYQPSIGMTWIQEKGEMKWMNGHWKLEDLGDSQTRAAYGLEGDPGRMLGLLLRGPVGDKVKQLLTKDAAEGLKKHAEAG